MATTVSTVTPLTTSTTSSSSTTSLDTLAAQYRATLQATAVTPLQTQESTLNSRISALSSLKSQLNTLYTSVQSLASTGSSSPFQAFNVSSTNDSAVEGTATSTAAIGSHTLDSVTRLAKSDLLLSNQVTGSDTSIITAVGSGTKTFSINGTQITVTLSDGETNDQVLADVSSAINSTSTAVSAAVLHIDSTHSELAFTSRTTGSANKISSVTDGNSTLAAALGFGSVTFTDTPGGSSRTVAVSGQAGFIEGNSANLDAVFSFDGVAMTRGTNSITDAVNGLTIQLLGTSSTPVSLVVTPNDSAIENTVTQFITNYNSVLSYLSSQTGTDATTGTRGVFADDSNVRFLASDLRGIVMHSVSSVAAGAPSVLSSIGITTNDDGTLTLSDKSKFEAALAANPTEVSDLFNSQNGVANQLVAKLKPFVTYGGTIDTETKGLNSQVKTLNDRIATANARIDTQVNDYIQQFEDIQALLDEAQQQQAIVSSFASIGT